MWNWISYIIYISNEKCVMGNEVWILIWNWKWEILKQEWWHWNWIVTLKLKFYIGIELWKWTWSGKCEFGYAMWHWKDEIWNWIKHQKIRYGFLDINFDIGNMKFEVGHGF